jgi:lipopolysaccharide transport system ATP-binding protein
MSSEGGETDDIVLSVQRVGKRYPQQRSLLDRVLRRQPSEPQPWALRDVSFEMRRGEALGIVGRNGSGKSTLLQMITGNLQLTEGRIEIGGRIGALLELGSGFNPDFTGRENVKLQGVLMGLSDRSIADLMPAIEEFADIGEYFDQPVRTYSSGMFVRLAFAVQVQTEPDILIVDEALAVGDALFQKRCFRRIESLQARGVSLLFVSHDQEAVRSLTQRALLLDRGRPLLLGSSGEVMLAYRKLLHEAERTWQQHALQQMVAAAVAAPDNAATSASGRLEFGDGDAQIVDVALQAADGTPTGVFTTGEAMRVAVRVRVLRDCEHLNVALRLRNRQGVKVYSWGTLNQDMAIRSGLARGEQFWPRRFVAGEEVTVRFDLDCRLGADFYEVQAAVSREDTPDYRNQRLQHWRDEAAFFQVLVPPDAGFFGGAFDLRMRASW